jgi:transposase
MIRIIKVARDTARKGRSSAIITLKQVIVNSPAELRETLTSLGDKALIDHCARFRIRDAECPQAACRHALRALARRWRDLEAEVKSHDLILGKLTTEASPTLRQGYGIGPDTAAEILIVLGDNPERIKSEAAFAKLCGVCPIPASSGLTNKHRLFRGGHRQANSALYRTAIVRMRFHEPTIEYVARRTAEGLTKKDIIRCLKRFIAREAYQRVMTDHRARLAAAHLPNT